jgi:hypothetical protein
MKLAVIVVTCKTRSKLRLQLNRTDCRLRPTKIRLLSRKNRLKVVMVKKSRLLSRKNRLKVAMVKKSRLLSRKNRLKVAMG